MAVSISAGSYREIAYMRGLKTLRDESTERLLEMKREYEVEMERHKRLPFLLGVLDTFLTGGADRPEDGTYRAVTEILEQRGVETAEGE